LDGDRERNKKNLGLLEDGKVVIEWRKERIPEKYSPP